MTTKRTPRNDAHRPGLVDPSDYEYLFSFSFGDFPFNNALMRATRDGRTHREPIYGAGEFGIEVRGYRDVTSPWGKVPYFLKTTGSESGCDICGAHFLHGDVFRKISTGEAIVIGHMCADKMGLVSNRGEWTANQKKMARLKKDAAYQQRRLELAALRRLDAVKVLEAHPGLEDALKVDHYISRDLAAKLDSYGSLSPAQIALALKIAREAAAPKAEESTLPEIAPIAGRQQIEGTVLGVKDVETDFGSTTKILVQVETGAGRFKLFGTMADSLYNDSPIKGARVRFTATVQPKEAGFGFFSRPTQATRIENAAVAA